MAAAEEHRAPDDLATLAAIGVLAACLSAVLHEGIGHGGACLASGGRIVQLSSVHFSCSQPRIWIDLAGSVGNLVGAGLAWLALRSPALAVRPALRLGLLMLAAFNLFWIGGYLIYSGLLGVGDWAWAGKRFLGDAWRPVAAVLGAAIYWASLRGVRTAISGFAVADDYPQPAGRRLRRLLLTPYLAGSVAACVAALVATAPGSMLQSALEFGGASVGLLLVRPGVAAAATDPAAASPIARSWGLLVVTLVIYAAWTATFGRGMGW